MGFDNLGRLSLSREGFFERGTSTKVFWKTPIEEHHSLIHHDALWSHVFTFVRRSSYTLISQPHLFSASRSDILGFERKINGIRERPRLEGIVNVAVSQLRHLFPVMFRHRVRYLHDAPVDHNVVAVSPFHL